MINIKHQSRLTVLQEFYYSKRDISATLVEAVFISLNNKTFVVLSADFDV